MDSLSENELERLKKLEEIKRHFQALLGNHLPLVALLFVLWLIGLSLLAYLKVASAPDRYTASVSLHYIPAASKYFAPYDAKYVFQLLNRREQYNDFLDGLEQERGGEKTMSPERARRGRGAASLPRNVIITFDPKQNNFFTIAISAPTAEDAVKFVNKFAETCITAYKQERRSKLNLERESVRRKRDETLLQIQQIDDETQKLGAALLVHAPEKEYERLRTLLANRQTELNRLDFAISGLEAQQKRLEDALDKINPALLDNLKELQGHLERLNKVKQEVTVARELYTAQNPKMKTLESRYQVMEQALQLFLSLHGLTTADIASMDNVVQLNADLKKVTAELEANLVSKAALEKDIADNNNRFQEINVLYPKAFQLTQERNFLAESVRTMDGRITDIDNLLPQLERDLFVGEYATSAVGRSAFDKKTIGLNLFISTVATIVLIILIVLVEYTIGRVQGEKELELYSHINYLGTLPDVADVVVPGSGNQMAFSAVGHHILSLKPKQHVIFVAALPGGANLSPGFYESLLSIFHMADKHPLLIDMVPSDDFDATPDMYAGHTEVIAYSEDRGYLPMINTNFFTLTILESIKRDLNVLKQFYDPILIKRSTSMRFNKIFIEELSGFCDGTMLGVQVKKTPRKFLRFMSKMQEKTKMLIMSFLFDVNAGKRSHRRK